MSGRRNQLMLMAKKIIQGRFDLGQPGGISGRASWRLCEGDALRKFSVGVGVRYDAPFFCLQA